MRLGLRAAVASAFVAAASAASAQAPAGGEFRVNTQTADMQFDADAASTPDGGFVVVWTSRVAAPADYDVFGQRYNPAGLPLGGEFRVNSYTTAVQRRPRVAVHRDGSFVVVWMSVQANQGFWGRRFDAGGAAVGAEFRIDTTGAGGTAPAIAMDGAGDFVVAWWNLAPLDPDGGVFAQRMSARGTRTGSEFRVNTYVTGPQLIPSVGVEKDGRFVIAWTSWLQDGSSYGAFAQSFEASGAPAGSEFRINAYTTGRQRDPQIATDGGDKFVVTWSSEGQDGSQYGVLARVYFIGGAPIGSEFRVNSFTTGQQIASGVAAQENGDFVVAWTSEFQDGARYGVTGQRFSAFGTRRGAEFLVNTYTPGEQVLPTLAHDPVGNFVVAWESRGGQDGSGSGVFAQRFGGIHPVALRVDTAGNRVIEPGETVDVRPSWRNHHGAAQAIAAAAMASGPPSGVPATIDGAASYGTLANGGTVECVDCYAITLPDPTPRPLGRPHWDAFLFEGLQPDVQGQHKRWLLHVGESFTDVLPASPFYRFVETILHHGVTTGCAIHPNGSSDYCPAAPAVRAQMAVFVLVAREGPLYLPPACTTPMFADVLPTDAFCRWIEELARRGVVTGCGGGNYCPAASVTREQMAVFVLRALDPALTPPPCAPPNLFLDVPETSPFCRWVEELANRAIVTGCGGGNYCPASPVTREQMTVFIVATFGLTLYGV